MKQNSHPLISVIIPFYKRLDYVICAIDSVYHQNIDLSRIQIIVSDEENSPKNKQLIESRYPQIIYTRNLYKKGPGGGRMSGLKYARGKYIVFLDSDDQLKPHFLTTMTSVIDKDNNVSGAVCMSQSFFEDGFKITSKLKLFFLMSIRDLSLVIGYFFNRTYLIPTSFYNCQISHMMFKASRIKGFKFNYDYLRGGEDWDYFVQVLQTGPIKIVLKRLTIFRYNLNSLTMTKANQELKWRSYSLLASRLPYDFKKGLFYRLFLMYINIFSQV